MLPVFGTGKKKLLYIKYIFHKFPQTISYGFAAARFKMRFVRLRNKPRRAFAKQIALVRLRSKHTPCICAANRVVHLRSKCA